MDAQSGVIRALLQTLRKLFLRELCALRLFSTKTPFCAPRLMASSPYDPVPANKSRKDTWVILSPKDENNLSRFASVAGLKFTPLGTCRGIPFASPPLILTMSGLINGFKDYIHT